MRPRGGCLLTCQDAFLFLYEARIGPCVSFLICYFRQLEEMCDDKVGQVDLVCG
jgi:hypothetical protein